MRKNKKTKDLNYLIITLICLLLILSIIPYNSIFGSTIDWNTQHTVFPDYFRKLFYNTKNFFPNFAISIGAGQNIYNFSYYGLYNPLLLISFFLPFISMKTYVIFINIIIFIATSLLTYYFFKTKTSKNIAFITTMLLTLSAPVLYHLHKHFMFVNYYPFLLLALIGVDKYLTEKKISLVTFSIFMIIMISYYYSIPSILVICIYAVYRYLELNPNYKIKNMLKTGLIFLIPIVIAITSASLLLLPTYYTLKQGRTVEVDSNSIMLLSRLIPKFNIDAYLYDNYSIGLTVISVISIVILLLSNKKHNQFLSIVLLILINIPLVVYLLNGNLYFRNKVFIPFIILVLIAISNLLEQLLKKDISLKTLILISTTIIILSLIFKYNNPLIYIDLISFNIFTYLFYKKKIKNNIYIILLLIAPTITFFISNTSDSYVKESTVNNNISTEIKQVLKDEKDIVRFNNLDDTLDTINYIYDPNYNQSSVYSSISNKLYKDFYTNVFKSALSYRNNLMLAQNNDILFQTFMGIKYIYSKNSVPSGYKKISKNLYKNENVLPVFYGTNKITNEEEFDKLTYPDNIEKLLSGVVVKDKTNFKNQVIAKKSNTTYQINKISNLTITKEEDYLQINSKKNGKIELTLDETLSSNDILIINLPLLNEQSCKKGDLRITVNSISNVKTCDTWTYKNNNNIFHYVLSSNSGIDKLTIKFNKGTYKIGDIETYKIKYKNIEKVIDKQSIFVVDKNKSNGDNINGTINMKESGYFVTSIPYDEGFTIKVDNKIVEKQIVNKAFLGFKLDKGNHKIEINYRAPYQRIGLILSIVGVITFTLILIYEKRSSK